MVKKGAGEERGHEREERKGRKETKKGAMHLNEQWRKREETGHGKKR
jgi:hypothetical protein